MVETGEISLLSQTKHLSWVLKEVWEVKVWELEVGVRGWECAELYRKKRNSSSSSN